jgi:O-antigen/teichoic acid export membrane protein
MFSRLTLTSLWLLMARIGTQVGLAVFTIILARQFGSSVFGEYTFIASLIVVGNVVTTFGTDMLLIREIASGDILPDLFSALMIQILLSVLFIAAIEILSSHLPNLDQDAVIALRIYSYSLIPLAFFTVFTTILRGNQHMAAYALLNLSLMMLQLAAIFWLKVHGGGIIILSILLLAVQLIGTLVAGALCQFQIEYSSQPWRAQLGQLWYLVKACAPIALLGLLGILYQRMSSILVLSLSGTASTGNYSAAARVVEAAKIGHVAVFTALYPLMAQVHATNKPNWIEAFRFPVLLLSGGAIIASLLLSWQAKLFIFILFGPGYISSIPALQVLAWMLIPYTINSFLSLAYLAEGEVTIIMIALMATIITLAALTVWWDPLMNIKGAAWAALFSETLQSIILSSWYFKQHRKLIIGRPVEGHCIS